MGGGGVHGVHIMYFGLCVFMCVCVGEEVGELYILMYTYICICIYRERDRSIGGSGWVGGVDILYVCMFFLHFFFQTWLSSHSFSPSCQVVFSSLPPGWTPVITISVAKTDFESPDKYVSKVIVGDKTVGTDYLKYDGKRGGGAQWGGSCDSIMLKVLDDEAAPGVVVDALGQLVVRIETSPAYFGYWNCYGQNGYGYYSLYVTVSVHFTEAKRLRETVKILPVTSSSGNSTTGRIATLAGSSNSRVEFPKETIPSVFTICSISRYSHASSHDSRNTFLTFFIDKFFQHFIRMSSGLWLFSNCC